MDSTITAAWIGAVAGFTVWLFNWFWMLWTEHRLGNRIRVMISIKIDDNLEMLRNFYTAAKSAEGFGNGSDFPDMQRGDALLLLPIPTWNYRVCDNLTTSIPLALSSDEIKQIHYLFGQLNQLTKLKALRAESLYDWKIQFEGIVKDILEKGNPFSTQSLVVEPSGEESSSKAKGAI